MNHLHWVLILSICSHHVQPPFPFPQLPLTGNTMIFPKVGKRETTSIGTANI